MAGTIQNRRRIRQSSTADVQEEITCAIFDKLLPIVLLGCFCQVSAAAFMAFCTGDRFLWKLTIVAVAIAIVRIAIVVVCSRRITAEFSPREATRCESLYGAATTLYSVNTGVITLYTIAKHTDYTIICIVGTFCLASGISGRVGMRPWIMQLCGVTMFTALGLATFHVGVLIFRVVGFLCVMYAIFYCRSVRFQFDMFVEQLRSRRRLKALAEQDALTGLANRRQFQMSLGDLCRTESAFAILYIDLDRFKHVNDTFGHAAGDTLLQRVAERLTGSIRSTDLLARLGGDEFAILQAPLDSSHAAETLARRINQCIANPFNIEGNEVRIGASVGIQLASQGRNDPNRLLSTADEALYRVKQSGGGAFSSSQSAV